MRPVSPVSPESDFVKNALETLRTAPFVVGVVALLALFSLRSPLAPIGLLLGFFGMGLLQLGILLLAWRRRNTALSVAQMTIAIIFTGPFIQSFGDLPFGTLSQAICLLGITLYGGLWCLRRAVVRFCRLDTESTGT